MAYNRMEFTEKIKRLYQCIEQEKIDAVVIGRRDNFSWVTCGGSNAVNLFSEFGSALLVVTPGKNYLIAKTMDLERIYAEELQCEEIFEPIPLKWYEYSP